MSLATRQSKQLNADGFGLVRETDSKDRGCSHARVEAEAKAKEEALALAKAKEEERLRYLSCILVYRINE